MNKKPNVILITIDALRADHLGFMGYQKNISPNLDIFSRESVVFSNAFSVSTTTPYSFPAILTSTYPLDFGGPTKIEKPRMLISEVFQRAGYVTAHFQTNPYISSFYGYNKGWDYFEDLRLSLTNNPDLFGQNSSWLKTNLGKIKSNLNDLFRYILLSSPWPQLYIFIRYLLARRAKKSYKVDATSVNSIAIEFLKAVKDSGRSFFLWLHYMDTHSPYLPGPFMIPQSFVEAVSGCYTSFLAQFPHKKHLKNLYKKYLSEIINLYDDRIQYVDQKIGELLEFLKKENLYQESIITLTADHGEEFFEHDGLEHPGVHGDKLYNELLRIPLLVKRLDGKGLEIKEKVSLIDLAPTLCQLAGVEPPSSFKGKNLFRSPTFPIFHQIAPYVSDPNFNLKQIFKKLKSATFACQTEEWKYIKHSKGEEIYDLTKDPNEQENLIKENPPALTEMRKKLKEFIKNNPPLSLT